MTTTPSASPPVLLHMQTYIDRWTETADTRAIFLRCYQMMTANMLTALTAGEFYDAAWVDRLLHRFADYYFQALTAYDTNPAAAPAVWQTTFACCRQPDVAVLQHLMLGVNAHINYDLVLVLVELLQPEWDTLPTPMRARRYADHSHVNLVIARTIDAVQDNVVEQLAPRMNWVDQMLGPLDEWLTSRLIRRWRDEVWQEALKQLNVETAVREQLRQHIEQNALRRAAAILQPQASNLSVLW